MKLHWRFLQCLITGIFHDLDVTDCWCLDQRHRDAVVQHLRQVSRLLLFVTIFLSSTGLQMSTWTASFSL